MKTAVPKKKYELIKSCIENKRFPLFIYGPSGTGKTTCILSILRHLKLPWQQIDLSTVEKVCLPLQSDMINIVEITTGQFKDLSKIMYKKNLIVESNVDYIPKNIDSFNKQSSFPGSLLKEITDEYTVIKICRTKFSQKNTRCNFHSKLQERADNLVRIDFFRFLGRIFNNRLNLSEISIANNNLLINTESIKNTFSKKMTNKKRLLCVRISKYKNYREKVNIERKIDIKTKNIIGSSESDDYSLLSSHTRAESDERIIPNKYSEVDLDSSLLDLSASSSEKYKEELEQENLKSSFDINKVILYISTNILNIVNFSDLPEIFDMISRTDSNSHAVIPLIGAIIAKPKFNNKTVQFYKSSYNCTQYLFYGNRAQFNTKKFKIYEIKRKGREDKHN